MEVLSKDQYPVIGQHSTRWNDNDVYGHVNNVVYYSYFDSAVNRYLIDQCGLDIHNARVVGYVVSSNCDYFRAFSYPADILIGVGVQKLGNSSVTYCIGIFDLESKDPCAQGTFTHVFVDRELNKSVAMPKDIRAGLEKILIS